MEPRLDKPSDSSGAGTMETILREGVASVLARNGFRVLNVPTDASSKEIERQYKQLEMALGFDPKSQEWPGFLRPAGMNLEIAQEARLRLRDAELRLVDEYFWFWPSGPGKDDPALQALAENDADRAAKLWHQPPNHPEEAAIHQHNLAVLHLLAAVSAEENPAPSADREKTVAALAKHWDDSVQQWTSIFDDRLVHEYLNERVRKLGDARLTPAFAARLHAAAPAVLLRLHARLALEAGERGDADSAPRHRKLMERYGCEDAVLVPALEEAVEPLTERIGHFCESAKKEAQGNKQASPQIIENLFKQTDPLLHSLDALAPESSVARDHAHDAIGLAALEICGGWIEQGEQWEKAREILTKVKPMVRSEWAKQELERNLTAVQQAAERWALFGRCWFCQQQPSKDESLRNVNFYKDVHKIGNTVHYTKSNLLVPRCPACAALHKRNELIVAVAAWTVGIIVGLICVRTQWGIIGLIGGGFIGGVIALHITQWILDMMLPKGQRPDSDAKKFPTIVDALKAGWIMGEKPPT